MDDNERLKKLYARLASLDNDNENQEVEKQIQGGSLSQDDESRLSYLKSQLEKIDNKELSLKDRALQFARGGVKTYGGLMDLAKSSIPNSLIENQNFDVLSGGTLSPQQMEELKLDPGQQRQLTGSISENAVNEINDIAGKDLTPTDTSGKFIEKLGEFTSLPVPGAAQTLKWGAPIAAASTGLRELGLDESWSDLIAAVGVPNIKALSQFPGNVIKRLGDYIGHLSKDYRQAGGVEKAADFLQKKVGEVNVPEVVKNIENFETPFKGDIAKGEAAYRPVTADIADNVGLSQYHRAKAENIPTIGERRKTNAEVLQREIDNLASKNASPQVSQEFVKAEREAYQAGLTAEEMAARQNLGDVVNDFTGSSTANNTGMQTHEYLENHVKNIKDTAQESAAPFYKAASTKSLEGRPQTAFDAIEEQLKKYSNTDPANRDARRAKIAIEHSGGEDFSKHKQLIKDIKKKYKNDPGMIETAIKAAGDVPRGTYTGESLDTAKKTLNRIYNEIPPNETERRAAFKKIMGSLDKDMESIPEIFEARKVYREIMQPANIITENPILGKLIKRGDGFTHQFTVTHAEIPQRIINGNKSIEAAEVLMHEISGAGKAEHKDLINTFKSYINSEILSEFVEKTGKINPNKFKTWSKSNPGAFILYPELKNKLKNLENAQTHVNRVIKKNEELISNFYKETINKFLGDKFKGVNPDRIAGRILDSSNSEGVMAEAVELLSKDKTGNGLEGLKRGIINNLNSKFKSDNLTFATLNDYLNKNKKALGKIFTKEQIQVLENSKDLLKQRSVVMGAGRETGGSNSIPILMENLAEVSGEKASKALFGLGNSSWAGKALGAIKNVGEAGKLDYIEKALLNPKMAKFLLQKDVKTKKNFFESIKNKEDFGKWLRNSKSEWEIIKEAGKGVGNNFSVTSEFFTKAYLNDKD